MTRWFDPKEKLPDDGQECLLIPIDFKGLITLAVLGPIAWKAKEQMWIDLFGSRELVAVKPEQVGLWALWGEIKPQEK